MNIESVSSSLELISNGISYAQWLQLRFVSEESHLFMKINKHNIYY